jgi:hypothetical protein
MSSGYYDDLIEAFLQKYSLVDKDQVRFLLINEVNPRLISIGAVEVCQYNLVKRIKLLMSKKQDSVSGPPMMDIFEGVDIEEMDDEAVVHMFMSGRTFKPSPNERLVLLQKYNSPRRKVPMKEYQLIKKLNK